MPPPRPNSSRSVGRNDSCPCGSGRKYKRCCLTKDEDEARRAAASRAAPPLPETEALGPLDAPTPASVAPVGGLPDPDPDFRDDGAEASSLPPELERRLDGLWDGFLANKEPTAEETAAFVEGLLELPHHATSWSDLLHQLAGAGHPALPAAFRRIADSVAHTHDTAMSYFYWAAAEEFAARDLPELLPEVAAGFRKLDLESYDADALAHLADWLLAEGFEAEVLALGEHFLPILRADDRLMPYAAPDTALLIFDMRVGKHLRTGVRPDADVERLADELRRNLEEDISPDAARIAAEVITGQAPPPAWSRAEFGLVSGNVATDAKARQDAQRLYRVQMHIAREAWELDRCPAGCTLYGLNLVLNSVYRAQADHQKQRKYAARNLLDHLQPPGMEARLARATYDLLGANVPRARLLLDSQEALLRLADRHRLMSEAEVVSARGNMEQIRRRLDG